jgi:hypothetical protein
VVIPEEVRRAHRDLGPLNEEFLDFVANCPAALRRSSFEAVHKYGFYPLTSWPVFVGGSKLAEMQRAAIELVRLSKKAPLAAFRGQTAAMAAFYSFPDPSLLSMILEEPNGFGGALARVDLIESEEGLKCLEVNLGAPGGLQVPAAESAYLASPVLQEFLAAQRLGVRCTNALEVLTEHLVEDVLGNLSWSAPELNLGIVADTDFAPDLRDSIAARMEALLSTVLARRAPSRRGSVVLGTFAALEMRPDGIWLRGSRVAGIVEMVAGSWHGRFRPWKTRQVALYNGPAVLVLDDKRNLALLSELQSSPQFTPDEQEMIRRWVPWTRQVKPGYTHREGERISLPDFVAAHRERLVLKPARSSQGNDVHLGFSTPPDTWNRVLREALARRDWIVQDYHESRPYLCQEGEEGCSVHDLVWGVFVFGSTYGGGFLRVLPKGRGEAINAARGARESILLEVTEV